MTYYSLLTEQNFADNNVAIMLILQEHLKKEKQYGSHKTMIKVNVDLTAVNYFSSGIGIFENEIVTRLSKYPDFDLLGFANYRRNPIAKDFSRFSFKTKYSNIPYKTYIQCKHAT